jgi:predicted ribosome quality control (RQC) complex YloA/Tae2 family protein
VNSLLAAFAECGKADEESGDPTAGAVLGPDLLARLEHSMNRAARRLTSLEAQLSGLEDPAAARALGDLILARYHEVPPGTSKATLTGFDGTSVEVELDPAEPAHANAARYYDRATRSERAAERLPRLLEKARVEVEELEDLARRVREGTADEGEVARRIGPAAPTPRGERQTRALPYRPFRSSGGLEIRVGKGAKYNDDLTFRHSSPNDVWLHARHTAGAHVVLRWQGEGRPPARDLQEAATLAALHSKARTSGSVPVDWTLRKYVRKPRRSPPGQVAVERTETLFVEPDETLLEKLQD